MKYLRLGFLASHTGSNMQAILDACMQGKLNAQGCVVISNNADSQALQRAAVQSLPAMYLSSKTHPDPNALDEAILQTLKQYAVDLVILAGYMRKLGPKTTAYFKNRILNIHPALLPKYGGKGMYGDAVHKAVLQAKETASGVTIHLVEDAYDQGVIIVQKKVQVMATDTVETLRKRILRQEHKLFPEVLQKISTGEIDLDTICKG